MKPLVFYFNFYDEENENQTTFGFVVEKPLPFYKFLNADEFDSALEEFHEKVVEAIESKYGVHDWSSSPSDEVDAIGYTSYEVEPENYQNLMNEWRDVFINSGCICTSVVEISKSAEKGNDYHIYLDILNRQ